MQAIQIRRALLPLTQRIGHFFGSFGTPNQYTLLTFIFGIASAVVIANQHPLWGILLLFFSAFFDMVDGAVAKAKQNGSRFGIVFDSIVDKTTETTVYLAIAWTNPLLFWPAIAAMTAFLIASYISKVGYEIQTKAQGGIAERRERFILLVIVLLALVYQPSWVELLLYFMATLSVITSFQRFYWIYHQSKTQPLPPIKAA